MAKQRVIQPVSFNVEDDYERKLLEYALSQQKYFSRYIKRLIEKDREGVPVVSAPQPVQAVTKVKDDSKKNQRLASSFL